MLNAPKHFLVTHVDRDGFQNEALCPLSGNCEVKCADVTMVCNHLGTVKPFPNWSDDGNPPICLHRTAIGF